MLTVEGVNFSPWAFLFCDVVDQCKYLCVTPASVAEIFTKALYRLVAQARVLVHPFYLPKLDVRLFNPVGIQPPTVAVR